jgi:ketosteroid isomerase-like protein
MESFVATDLDARMADFTEDSVLITGDQTLKGLAEIRSFFVAMFPAVTPEFLAAFNMVKQEISGDVAYINWNVAGFFALGTDTLVVKDGKISVQTFAAHPAG